MLTPEGLIKHNICLYLDTLRRQGKLDFWLNHSTGIFDAKTQSYRKRNSKWDRNGVADICGIMRGGQALFIEVKAPSGRLSENQTKFRDAAILWGAIYILAFSTEDVHLALHMKT